jgi:hypothetical protein
MSFVCFVQSSRYLLLQRSSNLFDMIPYLPKRRSAKLINIPRKLCLIQQEYAGIVSVPHNENNSLTVFPKMLRASGQVPWKERTCSDRRGEQQGKSLSITFKQAIQHSF